MFNIAAGGMKQMMDSIEKFWREKKGNAVERREGGCPNPIKSIKSNQSIIFLNFSYKGWMWKLTSKSTMKSTMKLSMKLIRQVAFRS